MVEMHHATPGAGRRLALHLTIATLAGLAIIALSKAYQPALVEWVKSDPALMRERARLLIAAAGAILVAPLILVAGYIWRVGARTIREERFPPERMKVIRDVPVIRGEEACRRGRVIQAFAVVLLTLAGLIGITLWRLVTPVPDA